MNEMEAKTDNYNVELKLESRRIYYSLFNYKEIPPVIGVILSSKTGITLLKYEYSTNSRNKYKEIKSYLKDNQESLLDLISMYLSSINAFADNINIEDLFMVEFGGAKIKMKVFLNYENSMLIVFLNSKTDVSLIQEDIIEHFDKLFKEYASIFKNYVDNETLKLLKALEISGEKWLNELNKIASNNLK